MVEMKTFDSFSALADALQKDATMLFLEDESHYVRQLMRFPIEELSIYPDLLFDALDRIYASHTRSFMRWLLPMKNYIVTSLIGYVTSFLSFLKKKKH